MNRQTLIIGHTKGLAPQDVAEKIEFAGRTCYKSADKITPGSADRFVKMVMKRGHESVIEHSWFVFKLVNSNQAWFTQVLLDILLANKMFSLTRSDDELYYLLSGNARMFRDYTRKAGHISGTGLAMLRELVLAYPVLFQDLEGINLENTGHPGVILNPNHDYSLEEKKKHWWAMVRFIGGSRAFTHQLVRHRPTGISQESQRYCDESGIAQTGYYVTPPSIIEAGMQDFYNEQIGNLDAAYQKLKACPGVKAEDARFLLPNACCSEIVMSANLEEWRWILHMRCDIHAQWEIREHAMDLLHQFKELFPGVFDDFIEAQDGKSAKLAA